jgi:hypothetical protein
MCMELILRRCRWSLFLVEVEVDLISRGRGWSVSEVKLVEFIKEHAKTLHIRSKMTIY